MIQDGPVRTLGRTPTTWAMRELRNDSNAASTNGRKVGRVEKKTTTDLQRNARLTEFTARLKELDSFAEYLPPSLVAQRVLAIIAQYTNQAGYPLELGNLSSRLNDIGPVPAAPPPKPERPKGPVIISEATFKEPKWTSEEPIKAEALPRTSENIEKTTQQAKQEYEAALEGYTESVTRCVKCGEYRPTETGYYGKGGKRDKTCKECRRARQKELDIKRRAAEAEQKRREQEPAGNIIQDREDPGWREREWADQGVEDHTGEDDHPKADGGVLVRRCERGNECSAYSALGEPAVLASNNPGPLCYRCEQRRRKTVEDQNRHLITRKSAHHDALAELSDKLEEQPKRYCTRGQRCIGAREGGKFAEANELEKDDKRWCKGCKRAAGLT